MPYIATGRIEHDGKTYMRGDLLPELQHEQLLALANAGAIVPQESEPAQAIEKKRKEEKQAELKALEEQLKKTLEVVEKELAKEEGVEPSESTATPEAPTKGQGKKKEEEQSAPADTSVPPETPPTPPEAPTEPPAPAEEQPTEEPLSVPSEEPETEPAEDVVTEPIPEEEPAEELTDGYDTMTKVELEDELESRGLPKSGNKAELIARLRENDASEGDTEEV